MNRPPKESRLVEAEQLRGFAVECAKAAGMQDQHAELLAECLTNAELRGVVSHGTRALPRYCREVEDGSLNADPEIRIISETANAVHLDGDGSLGYAPTMLATEKAIEKARATGVGIGAVCHIGHYGAAGHYVRRAMEQGCTALSVQGAYPQYYVDNKGIQVANYGNPPLCIGLPSDQEPPLVLDGATCIMADYQHGEEFYPLHDMIPAAFFKSMGYTGIGTALGGAFVGQANERAREVQKRWPHARQGSLVLVMRIDLFAPEEEVRHGIDALVRGVREEMVPLRGYDEATLPGTPEARNEVKYRREGVPIAMDTLERLEQLGEHLGVKAPWL